jgi:hypothetical protein
MVTTTQEAGMTDESYNGWRNYPTWAVNLWLSNDEGLYHETLAIVAGQHNPDNNETFRVNCADAIKRWVREDLTPDLGALDSVDWLEIADAWLEEVPA